MSMESTFWALHFGAFIVMKWLTMVTANIPRLQQLAAAAMVCSVYGRTMPDSRTPLTRDVLVPSDKIWKWQNDIKETIGPGSGLLLPYLVAYTKLR